MRVYSLAFPAPAVEAEVAQCLADVLADTHTEISVGLIPVTVTAIGVLEAVVGAKRGSGCGEARGAVRWPQAARAGGGEAGGGGDGGEGI